MVLQGFLPFVSGETITMKPDNNIDNQKIPKDRNSFLLPAEVNIGSNAEPTDYILNMRKIKTPVLAQSVCLLYDGLL